MKFGSNIICAVFVALLISFANTSDIQLETLPHNVLIQVTKYLCIRELYRLRFTSKRFENLDLFQCDALKELIGLNYLNEYSDVLKLGKYKFTGAGLDYVREHLKSQSNVYGISAINLNIVNENKSILSFKIINGFFAEVGLKKCSWLDETYYTVDNYGFTKQLIFLENNNGYFREKYSSPSEHAYLELCLGKNAIEHMGPFNKNLKKIYEFKFMGPSNNDIFIWDINFEETEKHYKIDVGTTLHPETKQVILSWYLKFSKVDNGYLDRVGILATKYEFGDEKVLRFIIGETYNVTTFRYFDEHRNIKLNIESSTKMKEDLEIISIDFHFKL
jgi:hypothetical protein